MNRKSITNLIVSRLVDLGVDMATEAIRDRLGRSRRMPPQRNDEPMIEEIGDPFEQKCKSVKESASVYIEAGKFDKTITGTVDFDGLRSREADLYTIKGEGMFLTKNNATDEVATEKECAVRYCENKTTFEICDECTELAQKARESLRSAEK